MKKTKRTIRSLINFLIATCFGIGQLPWWLSYILASVIAIPLWFILYNLSVVIAPYFFQPPFQSCYTLIILSLLLILSFIAIKTSEAYAKELQIKDPPQVVIDEVLGQTLSFVLTIPWTLLIVYFNEVPRKILPANSNLTFLIALALNICLFRLFDSVKPWPIGKLERLKGGWGIVLDDIGAGILTAIAYYLIMVNI